jgi:hypothetical protein
LGEGQRGIKGVNDRSPKSLNVFAFVLKCCYNSNNINKNKNMKEKSNLLKSSNLILVIPALILLLNGAYIIAVNIRPLGLSFGYFSFNIALMYLNLIYGILWIISSVGIMKLKRWGLFVFAGIMLVQVLTLPIASLVFDLQVRSLSLSFIVNLIILLILFLNYKKFSKR